MRLSDNHRQRRKLRRCVYCGGRTYEGHWVTKRRFVPACIAHLDLVWIDPHYREDAAA